MAIEKKLIIDKNKDYYIFVSGAITGEPILECVEKFRRGAAYFQFKFSIDNKCALPIMINPLALKGIYFGIHHDRAMRICQNQLKKCNAIFMLKGWQYSKGATIEHNKAKQLGLEIFYETEKERKESFV